MSKKILQNRSTLSREELSDTCEKCSHRKICKSPCIFVEKLLCADNRKPFEKNIGDNATILYPKSKREINESSLDTYDDGKFSKRVQFYFSDANESIFLTDIEPKLKQTGIFIDRFFFKMSYQQLADKYGVSKSGVAKLYVNAKERLIKTIDVMDRVELAKSTGKPLAAMPKGVRVFLLHALLGLSNGEICKLLGVSHTLVNRYITQTRDKIMCGEIDILSYSDGDLQKANARLKKTREKRKEYDEKRQAKISISQI